MEIKMVSIAINPNISGDSNLANIICTAKLIICTENCCAKVHITPFTAFFFNDIYYNLLSQSFKIPFTSYTTPPSFRKCFKSKSKNSLWATVKMMASKRWLVVGELWSVTCGGVMVSKGCTSRASVPEKHSLMFWQLLMPYSCITSSGFAHGSKVVTWIPYSSKLCITSTAFVLRTSGQFSLKVIPKFNTREPFTLIPFLIMHFTTCEATYSP